MSNLKTKQADEKLNISRRIDGCIQAPEESLDEMIRYQIEGKYQAKIEGIPVLFDAGAGRRKEKGAPETE